MLVGFTNEDIEDGYVTVDAPLVYIKHDEGIQYYWTHGISPYTIPLRLGTGTYDIRLYHQDDDGVYRYYQRDKVYSDYEPTYLENTYDCFGFEELEINIDPIIQQVKEYCSQQEGWVCEQDAKYLAWYLRRLNIPCKVVVGQVYSEELKSVRHAWNQVYINGEWQTVDISLDDVVVRVQGWIE